MTTSLTVTWRCLTCDEHGNCPPLNAAEKHTHATGHPTVTEGRPT